MRRCKENYQPRGALCVLPKSVSLLLLTSLKKKGNTRTAPKRNEITPPEPKLGLATTDAQVNRKLERCAITAQKQNEITKMFHSDPGRTVRHLRKPGQN